MAMSFRWPLNALVLALLGALTSVAAHATDLRLGLIAGYGVAGVTVSSTTLNETPAMFAVDVEYSIDTNKTLAFEHLRTFQVSPLASGIGVTTLVGRYYFLNSVPAILPSGDDIFQTSWYRKAISPYFGFGAGYSLATLTKTITSGVTSTTIVLNSSSPAFVGKLGVDYPFLRGLGTRLEAGLGTSLNSEVTFVQVALGLFWFIP
jgi:hypothetical protein